MTPFRHLKIGLLVLISFALSGCSSNLDRQEAAVYAAFVDEHFTTVADSTQPLKRHIICDRTSGFQIVSSWRKEISKLPVVPSADTIDDFLARNDGKYPESFLNEETRKVLGRYQLNPHIGFRLPHVLISDATIAKLFEQGGGGWLEFNRRFPNNHGILWLSRVGFDNSRNQAIFYVGNQYTEAAGEGKLVLLQKRDGIWKEVATSRCWIS